MATTTRVLASMHPPLRWEERKLSPPGRVDGVARKLPVKRPRLQAPIARVHGHINKSCIPAGNVNPCRPSRTPSLTITANEKSHLLSAGVPNKSRTRCHYDTIVRIKEVDLEANRCAEDIRRRWERQWDIESLILIIIILAALIVFCVLGWKTQARFDKGVVPGQ